MADPLVKKRLPDLILEDRVSKASKKYVYRDRPGATEEVTSVWSDFRVRQADRTLATAMGSAYLPTTLGFGRSDSLTTHGEDSYGLGLFSELLDNPAFTQDDLIQFAQSAIGEVRFGALKHLSKKWLDNPAFTQDDLIQLAQSAPEDVRYWALTHISKGDRLDSFARQEKSDGLREVIVRDLGISDAALLKVAKEDPKREIRLCACVRILNKAILRVHVDASPETRVAENIAGSIWLIREADKARLSWGTSWGSPYPDNFFWMVSFKSDGSCVWETDLTPDQLQPGPKYYLRHHGSWKQDHSTVQLALGSHIKLEAYIADNQMTGKITSRKPAKVNGNCVGICVDSAPQ